MTNATHEKLIANIMLTGEKLKAFALRSGKRKECPLSPLLFNIVVEVLARELVRKRKKKYPNLKRKNISVHS